MLGAIIILITFVAGQCIAHYSKWVQSKSLLVLLLVSIVFIGSSMGAYVMLSLQSPYVIIVPTILCATCLSAKYRFTSMALIQRVKEMQSMERKLEFHFIQNIQRKKRYGIHFGSGTTVFQEYSHAYCL